MSSNSLIWRDLARIWLRRLAFCLPLLSLTYLLRFHVARLPSTVLELVVWVFFFGVLVVNGRDGLAVAHAKLRPWSWAIMAWLLATLVAVGVSPSLWTGLGLWRAYVLEPLLVLAALCALLDQPGDRRRMEQGMMVAGVFASVWAIIGYLGNWGIPKPWNVALTAGRRAVGPFGFPNAVALFVAPIGALAVAKLAALKASLSLNTKTDRNMLALSIVTIIFSVFALLAARSEGGMLAFAVATTCSLLGIRRGRWVVAIGTVLGVIALAAIPVLRHALVHEITFQGWSGKVRLIMWRETWAMLKDHWLFGAGFGGYPIVFDAYHKARFIEIFQYPHNILLNFWTETGLLGIAAFVGVVGSWLRNASRTIHEKLRTSTTAGAPESSRSYRYSLTLVLIAPLFAMLVHGLVDVPYFKNDLALWFWLFVWLVISARFETDLLA